MAFNFLKPWFSKECLTVFGDHSFDISFPRTLRRLMIFLKNETFSTHSMLNEFGNMVTLYFNIFSFFFKIILMFSAKKRYDYRSLTVYDVNLTWLIFFQIFIWYDFFFFFLQININPNEWGYSVRVCCSGH